MDGGRTLYLGPPLYMHAITLVFFRVFGCRWWHFQMLLWKHKDKYKNIIAL